MHLNFASNAEAPENIFACADVAAGPVHEEMSWLNAVAPLNMYVISPTCEVSQPPNLPMAWLKSLAILKVRCMRVTCDVSQPEMSWLNLYAK